VQLVQLQDVQRQFKGKKIGLVAISYDTPEILKAFSEQRGITFPLLADPQSDIIRRFGLLNPRGTGFTDGMAIPGYFHVGKDGRIKEMFFEDIDNDRYTANNVLVKLFPQLARAAEKSIAAPHVALKVSQSDTTVVLGNRTTLVATLSLPPDIHVYAPGVHGRYKPVALELEPTPGAKLRPVRYPQSKVLLLPAINEKVPVFEGTFQITQDITITNRGGAFVERLQKGPASGTELTVNGKLRYQACSSTTCYPPTAVPVSWKIKVMPIILREGKGDAEAGKLVFQQYCISCHGQDGVGSDITWSMDGTVTLKIRPIYVTTPGMSDAEMRNLITKGYGPIKPVPGLTPLEVENAVAYVRSLEKK
jgi:cytochrome c553